MPYRSLRRLLKSLNEDAKSKKAGAGVPAKAVAQPVRQSELLDLNADDTDNLLAHVRSFVFRLHVADH